MPPGIIPVSNIPGWPNPPAGLMPACQKSLDDAGFTGPLFINPAGLRTPDISNTQNVLNTYTGSASELTYTKNTRITALDNKTDLTYDLASLARGNTGATLTSTNVGQYLASVGNNYRTKKAAINAAANTAAVNAVDINTGWPAYP